MWLDECGRPHKHMVQIASVNDAGPSQTYDKINIHTFELLLNSRCVLQQIVRKMRIDASGRKTATWKQLDSSVDKSSIHPSSHYSANYIHMLHLEYTSPHPYSIG